MIAILVMGWMAFHCPLTEIKVKQGAAIRIIKSRDDAPLAW
jgi:hypothetical protein